MDITFSIPFVFYPGSPHDENAEALKDLLDGLIALNSTYLRYHTVAPLYRSGVVYRNTEIWDTVPALYRKGYGDCKSLTAALIAEYRKAGKWCRPVFRFNTNPNQTFSFHILVQTEHGFEDPSKILGMPTHD